MKLLQYQHFRNWPKWMALPANWLFKGWRAPQEAHSNHEPPRCLKILRHRDLGCFKISALLWVHFSKRELQAPLCIPLSESSARPQRPPTVVHTSLFCATYFPPTKPGNSRQTRLPLRSRKKGVRISIQFMAIYLSQASFLTCSPFCPSPGSPFSPFCCRVCAWMPGMRLAGISPREGHAEHCSPCAAGRTVRDFH